MNWKRPAERSLLKAILALNTADGARRFLQDLLTPEEIMEFSKRFRAAQLLTKKVPYSAIERETGLSSTTVARVSKSLQGSAGGYRSVIARLHHHSASLARGR
jgi:TrpR-related protein YerC/YecD